MPRRGSHTAEKSLCGGALAHCADEQLSSRPWPHLPACSAPSAPLGLLLLCSFALCCPWPWRAQAQVLSYQGGPVMSGPVNVYFIYYGNWSNKGSPVLENFITSLRIARTTPRGLGVARAADWWRIVTKYTDAAGKPVGQVFFRGRVFDYYSHGADLTNKVSNVLEAQFTKTRLPLIADPRGVYMLITSKDVTETPTVGFCAGTYPPPPGGPFIGYCGWHASYVSASKQIVIKYAFIGNADQCVQRCGHLEGYPATPNGDVGTDAAVNVIGHELAESVTDPTQQGWIIPSTGDENGDLCNRMFGAVNVSTNGGYIYNLVGEGGMRFLVQTMWDPAYRACRMQP